MVIVYGYRNKLKVQKNLGASICPNCGMYKTLDNSEFKQMSL